MVVSYIKHLFARLRRIVTVMRIEEGHDEKLEVRNEDFIPYVIATMHKTNKSGIIPLKGLSMNPWLVGGRDKAVLELIVGQINVNDVILAELSPGFYALHRVLHVDNERVQLLGDGNLTPDPVIPLSAVLAKAIGFYRKGSKEMQSADARAYIIYINIWMKLRPLRRYLLAIYRHFIMPRKYRP